MKVFITGKKGYVSNALKKWLENNSSNEKIEVELIDVRTASWKQNDFSDVDVVVHAASIVHQPNNNDEQEYKRVNVDLTFNLAKHSKKCGVKQFVFISSMAVYGLDKSLPKANIITIDTPCNPNSLYGKSKLLAEKKITDLQSDSFAITIVRPPNIYGANCKGNYIPYFIRMMKIVPVIPSCYNDVYQSMIYIDNLCEFLSQLILKKLSGIYLPQDDCKISSVLIMDIISKELGRKVFCSKLLGKFFSLFKPNSLITKLYGGVAYSFESTRYDIIKYQNTTFEEAMKKTVREYEKN